MLPGNTEDIFALMELCDLEEQITKSAIPWIRRVPTTIPLTT